LPLKALLFGIETVGHLCEVFRSAVVETFDFNGSVVNPTSPLSAFNSHVFLLRPWSNQIYYFKSKKGQKKKKAANSEKVVLEQDFSPNHKESVEFVISKEDPLISIPCI
jgi:hypothetical protein